MAVHTARTLEAPDYPFQASELSWEPTERWLQLPREARRSRRGEKTVQPLAHLRRSDPLINAFAWRDLGEELRRIEDSQAARTNQQATATALRRAAPAPRRPYLPPDPRSLPCRRVPTPRGGCSPSSSPAGAYPARHISALYLRNISPVSAAQARILRGIAEHRLLTRLQLERMEKGVQEEGVEVRARVRTG